MECSGWVDGWMGGWVGGWMDGSKSRVKDCLQQSIIVENTLYGGRKDGWMEAKARLRIAYSNQKRNTIVQNKFFLVFILNETETDI